jgi:lipid-binding SYLF domain-containing protein
MDAASELQIRSATKNVRAILRISCLREGLTIPLPVAKSQQTLLLARIARALPPDRVHPEDALAESMEGRMNTYLNLTPRLRDAFLGLLVAAAMAGCSSQPTTPSEPDQLVSDARKTLSNFIRDPDQTWIQENLPRAKAVMIAPQIVKAGFIFGGSGGRAVLVARDGRTWAGPAFYDLGTASVGFQAGVEVSEAIIVVMTDRGLNSLLSTSFKMGGDASIAAGPVGAGAKSTITADLITFARAKGVYGGVNLDGTVVNTNISWNNAYYGKNNVLPPDILIRKTATSPKSSGLLNEIASATK